MMANHSYKVGDTVYIRSTNGWSVWRSREATVEKVTPTGRITAGGIVFDKRGCEYGRGSRWSRGSDLVSLEQHLAIVAEVADTKAKDAVAEIADKLSRARKLEWDEIRALIDSFSLPPTPIDRGDA